jgi:HEAT repeat protein
MLRSPRKIISLISTLALGTAYTVATVATTSMLVSCKDESQPDYWIDKLEDAKYRPNAVKRLTQFFEDAVTKANNDATTPEVRALLDKIIDPLIKTYVEHYADLDTKTRVSLIKLLSDIRDPRTEPALKKAFEEFAKRPRSTTDEADIKWAVRSAADLKLPGLSGPILAAFEKLEAHTMLGGIVYKDYNSAMTEIADKSWTSGLIAKLGADIVRPKTKKDTDKIDPYRDQVFWQTTAAEVLGIIKAPEAVEPLLKVLLDPEKVDAANTVLLALVKIGKPAVDRAAKLLSGDDEKLTSYYKAKVQKASDAKEPSQDPIQIEIAAAILGTAGSPAGLDPMLKMLQGDLKATYKAHIVKELPKIPGTPQSIAAFKSAAEAIPLDESLGGAPALVIIAESAGQFYDPSLVTWLLDQASNVKGTGDEKKMFQGSALLTALKLAQPGQMKQVKSAINQMGTQVEKDMYALADKVVAACSENAECYLKEMEKSENQDQKNQFAAIKAGYMIGIYGNDKVRDEMVDALESFENAGVRFVAAQTIDHLTPKGSPDIVKKLTAVIKKNKESADTDKAAADAPVKQVMYRIDGRG